MTKTWIEQNQCYTTGSKFRGIRIKKKYVYSHILDHCLQTI